jgi:hypothetical protein
MKTKSKFQILEESIQYRIVEKDVRCNIPGHPLFVSGFLVEKEYLKDVGWMLWPIWEKRWIGLDIHGNQCDYYSNNRKHFYGNLDEAQEAICRFKNPKNIIHQPKC